ncbi:MAG: hypothetical protein QG559_1220 [Campylobacterota bacterium]|nr:hypothetical protein [Campylobacterota bacterium]
MLEFHKAYIENGVVMANKKVGKVIKLFISKKGDSQRYEESFIELDEEGVIGDKFYAKDTIRSVLITSTDSYELVQKYDIEIPHGYLGENILMDFNPYSLPVGSQLKIGSALLEISQNCTICNHLSTIDKRVPKLLKNDRGIFAKVVQGGKISQEDDIYLV